MLIRTLCVAFFLTTTLVQGSLHASSPTQTSAERLKELCDAYTLDFPIKVPKAQGNRWYENEMLSQTIRTLLREKGNTWIETVSFRGDSLIFEGVCVVPLLSRRSSDEIRRILGYNIKKQLEGCFTTPVNISVLCEISRTGGGLGITAGFSPRNLKDNFIIHDPKAGDKINYNAVWVSILSSGSPTRGMEIDLNSEKRESGTRTVSTLWVVDEHDGFVTRYSTKVTMRDDGKEKGDFVLLEIVVHGSRRRTSSTDWKEFSLGEAIRLDTFASNGHIEVYKTSIPLYNSILSRLKI